MLEYLLRSTEPDRPGECHILEKSTRRMSNYELLYWVDLEGPVTLEAVSHKRGVVPETGFQLITVQ